MGCLDGITDSLDTSLSELQETVKGREAWRPAVHGVAWNRTRLSQQATASNKHSQLDLAFPKLITLWLHLKCALRLTFFSACTLLKSSFQKEDHRPLTS